jgi:hypothetical protein
MKKQIELMKQWCADHYEQGADTMVECWSDTDYEELFTTHDGQPRTTEQAWQSLRAIASVYADQQADARNSAF